MMFLRITGETNVISVQGGCAQRCRDCAFTKHMSKTSFNFHLFCFISVLVTPFTKYALQVSGVIQVVLHYHARCAMHAIFGLFDFGFCGCVCLFCMSD